MTYRDQLIEDLKNIKIALEVKHGDVLCDMFEMDNLDRASLINFYGKVSVRNEHDTVYDLNVLSDVELEVFANEMEIPSRCDYLIVDSNNNWLSFGKNETEKVMEDELENLFNEIDLGTELILFKAKEMTKESVRKRVKKS
jgi:hypothetical protein